MRSTGLVALMTEKGGTYCENIRVSTTQNVRGRFARQKVGAHRIVLPRPQGD